MGYYARNYASIIGQTLVVNQSLILLQNNGSLKNYFNIELNGNYFDLVVSVILVQSSILA